MSEWYKLYDRNSLHRIAFVCEVAAALVALDEGRLEDVRNLLEDLGGFDRTPYTRTAKTDESQGPSLEGANPCE